MTKRNITAIAIAACACLTAALPSASSGADGARGTRAVNYNPLEGDNGFGVLVEGNTFLGSTESEGPVAMGGNLSFGTYNVSLHNVGTYTAPGDTRPAGLVVNGRVDLAGSVPGGVLSLLSDRYVKIGDLTGVQALITDSNGASVNTQITATGAGYNSTPRIGLTTQQTPASVAASSGFDVAALFPTYRARATEMATCATTVILRDSAGNPLPQQEGFPAGTSAYITLTDNTTNVLNLSGADLENLGEIVFTSPPTATAPLVISVDTTATGGVYTWNVPNQANASAGASYILWNFADATDLTIATGDSIEGTVYAPGAAVTDINASNIEGTVVAKSFSAGPVVSGNVVNAGEIHYFPFSANVTCTDTTPTEPPTTAPPTTAPPTTEPPTTAPPTTEPPTEPPSEPPSWPPSEPPTEHPTWLPTGLPTWFPTDGWTPPPTGYPGVTPHGQEPPPAELPVADTVDQAHRGLAGTELAGTGLSDSVRFAVAGALALTAAGVALFRRGRRQRD